MKHKRVVAILAGCLVATCLGMICASQYIVGKMKISSRETASLSQEPSISAVYTTNRVYVNPATSGSYEKLNFNSIDEFLTSLNDLTNINNIDVLYEERLYSSEEKDIVSLYQSSDSNISITVLPDGSLSTCIFEGVSREDEAKIKSLSEGSGYNFKVISDGFMLEPDIIGL